MINWSKKSHGGGTKSADDADVYIRFAENTTKSYTALVFKFSPEAKKILFRDSVYVTDGYDRATNRLYFKPSDRENGFKLGKIGNVYRTARKALDEDFLIGDYRIFYDRDNSLYYADIEKKLH